MRILIVAFGSRGDVAPFTGLGARLREAGHTVTIAAHPSFRPLVTGAGLRLHDLPGDLGVLLDLPPSSSPRFLASRITGMTELLRQAGQATLAAAADADMILLNSSAPFAYDIAEGLGLPSAGVYAQPMTPTGDFPPIVLHSARSLGRAGNRLIGELAMRTLIPFNRVAAELRAQLGLPRRSPGATIAAQAAARWPVLHGFSEAVLPRPSDWRPGLDVVGYWWPHHDPTWEPPADLVDFLAAGPPPVVIGFGSMAGGHGGRLGPLVAEALRTAGLRGIVQAGWAGLDAGPNDDVLTIGEVPHEWLFPQVAGVAHHAGAGTTAAALRAGVPSVPLPVFADQPLWARRLVTLGCAPAVVPFQKLTAAVLAQALGAAVGNPRHRAAAQAVAARLREEDGTAAVVRAVSTAAVG
ncbi:glycosyltransferase [Actinomycetes bacterium KLBMP 9759]